MDSTSQKISETAKAEGGPSTGSTSAQMQSEVGKKQNFEQAAQEVGAKMQNDPASVTSEVSARHYTPTNLLTFSGCQLSQV